MRRGLPSEHVKNTRKSRFVGETGINLQIGPGLLVRFKFLMIFSRFSFFSFSFVFAAVIGLLLGLLAV